MMRTELVMEREKRKVVVVVIVVLIPTDGKLVVVITAGTLAEVLLKAMAHFLPDLGPWTKYHW